MAQEKFVQSRGIVELFKEGSRREVMRVLLREMNWKLGRARLSQRELGDELSYSMTAIVTQLRRLDADNVITRGHMEVWLNPYFFHRGLAIGYDAAQLRYDKFRELHRKS